MYSGSMLVPAKAPKSRWLFRAGILAAIFLTVGGMNRDAEGSTSSIAGLGRLHVLGMTEGKDHELPGKTSMLSFLPDSWRDAAARGLGYRQVAWTASDKQEELLVWCDWRLTNALPSCGWFEPVLVDRGGQVIAAGKYPGVGYHSGREIEPIRFAKAILPAGTSLQIRRFQPGSPYRDVIAQVALPEL